MEKHPQQNDSNSTQKNLQKLKTHIEGLDKILNGGFSAGRTTLISGGPGTGKSVLGLEFIYRGAMSGHPGIFVSFEETGEDIRRNALTFGWDLAALEQAGAFFLMEGQIGPDIFRSGDFNLKGLLAIIDGIAEEMGAHRITIDALDILMRLFHDPKKQQNEIFSLNNWLKDRKMTALLTAKSIKGKDAYEYDYLEFMADCVIHLDQRVRDQVNTKRLKVTKYRGSRYETNEYPFLVVDHGMVFNSISDIDLSYEPLSQRISSGNRFLDDILGGGYRKGSCILVTGVTGTGKTSMASTFAHSACEKGQKVLYVNFEESRKSLVAGMLSIGIDLRPAIEDDSLRLMTMMPESMGIEEHLYHEMTTIKSFQPEHLVVDAISACKRIAGEKASFDFLMRLIHFCRKRGITVILINQAKSAWKYHQISGIGLSSLIDTIITLHYKDVGNETNRMLQVKKSRGTRHSNKYHTYFLTEKGIQFDTD